MTSITHEEKMREMELELRLAETKLELANASVGGYSTGTGVEENSAGDDSDDDEAFLEKTLGTAEMIMQITNAELHPLPSSRLARPADFEALLESITDESLGTEDGSRSLRDFSPIRLYIQQIETRLANVEAAYSQLFRSVSEYEQNTGYGDIDNPPIFAYAKDSLEACIQVSYMIMHAMGHTYFTRLQNANKAVNIARDNPIGSFDALLKDDAAPIVKKMEKMDKAKAAKSTYRNKQRNRNRNRKGKGNNTGYRGYNRNGSSDSTKNPKFRKRVATDSGASS